jgi:CheY-like chemotaxis protein
MDPIKHKVLLLVEDDTILRDMYKTEFEGNDLIVDTAANGEEGLQKLQTEKPNIIVLDLVMPKMSGFDFLDKLQQNPETAQIPVIVLTNIMVDVEEMVKKGKVVKCLIKSETTPAKVLEEIKKILGAA